MEKALKKMSRMELIEIISHYQKIERTLTEKCAELQQALDDRRILIENAGSIAEAAVSLNDVFAAAQRAADQYLAEIACLRMEAEQAAEEIISRARAQADDLLAETRHKCEKMRQEAQGHAATEGETECKLKRIVLPFNIQGPLTER